MIGSIPKITSDQQWHEKFPSSLTGLFAFYQCLCTFTIIGCELGSILIDVFNATIYVGFWASLFFMIAWISQAISVTYRPTRKCAKFTLIIQSITLIFSICVIGFDAYFIINPSACFFSLTLCNSTAPTRGVYYSVEHFNNVKIPLIKGQLATAAIMFAFGIDYIIMYITTRRQMKNTTQSIAIMATNNTIHRVSTTSPVTKIFTINPNARNISALSTKNRNISSLSAKSRNISALSSKNRNNSSLMDTTFELASAKSFHQSRWSVESIEI